MWLQGRLPTCRSLKDMDPSEELEKEEQKRQKEAMAIWNHRRAHGEVDAVGGGAGNPVPKDMRWPGGQQVQGMRKGH